MHAEQVHTVHDTVRVQNHFFSIGKNGIFFGLDLLCRTKIQKRNIINYRIPIRGGSSLGLELEGLELEGLGLIL